MPTKDELIAQLNSNEAVDVIHEKINASDKKNYVLVITFEKDKTGYLYKIYKRAVKD